MALLPIRKFGDPVLRTRANEVEEITDVHRRLAADMLETMRDAPGVGLAGPQVGILERIFVWEVEDEHGVVINPIIMNRSDAVDEEEEGCLSIPGIAYPVVRSTGVHVKALDLDGQQVTLEADDFLARVFQHEIDHLDGVLFIDRLPDALRKEALEVLRDQALGLPSKKPEIPPEEIL